ncbi:hypothetical protein I545_2808 [Mycobacterium kansasii 662]|uniref:Uncharacterized protein n=2 Tax=Mycobacterium kansasii TaxID=1768 RepID=A0A653EGA8_MYCKA|nr:hypothetical protein I545_2808 [Mycobacterium kansasii 662]GFP49829.1 hypothetical protein MKANGN_37070 [Mycobacterium kansasii]VAZ67619.1 hypothetical protein LAUMK40_03759 [Mycobacterium kansasii]VAZ77150.1 hypothetical protein LAUMK7_03732 [Mycobacterium kansasii]VTO96342.1 hypothetical protein BIN_B_00369 [Mycobacterium kansasii]
MASATTTTTSAANIHQGSGAWFDLRPGRATWGLVDGATPHLPFGDRLGGSGGGGEG